MRVYLDACIDPRVAELFEGHQVTTAFQLGWHQLKDHVLLPRVQGQFDVFVTIDGGFEHEHNLKKLFFGIVIIHVTKNKLEFYRPLARFLREAVIEGATGPRRSCGRWRITLRPCRSCQQRRGKSARKYPVCRM